MTATIAPTLWQLPDEELTALLLVREENLRTSYADVLAVISEIEQRGLGKDLGYKDTAAMLRESLRISVREAHTRIAQAAATMPTSSLIGVPQPPPLAATGEALAAGDLNHEHLQAITAIFQACPAAITRERRAEDEATLLKLARQAGPEAVRTAGRRLISYWEQETTPPEEAGQDNLRPRRTLHVTHRPDGSARLSGELDAETTAVLDGLLGPLAKPRKDPDMGDSTDLRNAAERRGDALAEIIGLAARCDELTVQGGERAVMIVSTTLEKLEHRVDQALPASPGVGSADALLRSACDAKVVPAVFDTTGQPLFIGRAKRLATSAQRHALTLRDRGCAHPGCDRGPKWTSPHHVVPWSRGGSTDLDNLVLLCERHHRIAHHTGWEIRFRHGIPEFVPPPWLDRQRKPQRNVAHGIGPPAGQNAA